MNSKQIVNNEVKKINNIYPGHSNAGLGLDNFFQEKVYKKIFSFFKNIGFDQVENKDKISKNIYVFKKRNSMIYTYITTNNWDNSSKNNLIEKFKLGIPIQDNFIKSKILNNNIRNNVFIFSPYVPLKEDKHFNKDSFDFKNMKLIVLNNNEFINVTKRKSAFNMTNRWIYIEEILRGGNKNNTLKALSLSEFQSLINNTSPKKDSIENILQEYQYKLKGLPSNLEKKSKEQYIKYMERYVKKIRNPIGQYHFRQDLINEVKNNSNNKYIDMLHSIEQYNNHFLKENLIIASHIKEFSKLNDKDAFDFNNGLLLPTYVDTFFDQKLITFNYKDGKSIVSQRLSNTIPKNITKQLQNLTIENSYLTADRKKYLELHNKDFKVLDK